MNSVPFLLHGFGYRSAFLYAGDALFDNMGHFWSSIGFDNVWDQGDFTETGFSTASGYPDECLYKAATKRPDQMTGGGKPAFLARWTDHNPRHFTYPQGRTDKR